MLKFAVVGLQPELLSPVATCGVVGRAFARGLASMELFSPREHAHDRHRTVDDRAYGGGPGMVLKFGPVAAAIREALERLPPGSRRIALAAEGRRFDQAMAAELAAAGGVLLVAGRYEGLDERLYDAFALERVSLGDFVLSGGEPAAAVIVDATVRLLPGALNDAESAEQDSFSTGLLDCPHYTRPETVDGMTVPPVLLGGDHEAVRRWRLKQSLGRTWRWRPDLLEGRSLSAEETELLAEYRREGAGDCRDQTQTITAVRPGSGDDNERTDSGD